MELRIRRALPDDAEAIVRILNPIIEAGRYTVLDRTFTVEEEREFIANFPKRGVFHVAEEENGKVIGFQSIEPFAPSLRAFDHVAGIATFVDLSFRQQGVGACLSGITFEAGKQEGFEKIFTYVRADNPASLAFHLKIGFRIIGTSQRQAKVGGRYIDEVVIEKLL
ncbi:MAG: GNAT family N-acetyltransferase [Candidatus Abyssubacteria bacterium]